MIILQEDKNIVSMVPRDEAYELLLALFSAEDELPELSPAAYVVYTVIRSKSERISERKASAGRKGGAPENNRNASKQTKQADARKTTYRTTTVPDTVPVSVPDTGTEPDTGTGSTCGAEAPPRAGARTRTTARFAPPAAGEVRHYCAERGNGLDADRFVDYYASNGWKVGKNPMKDWRAAVRTWERFQSPQARAGPPQGENPFVRLLDRMEKGEVRFDDVPLDTSPPPT